MPAEQPYLNLLNARSHWEQRRAGSRLREKDRQEDKMEKKSGCDETVLWRKH